MKFDYNDKRYDVRLKRRYLPAGIKDIGSLDLMILMNSTTSHQMKTYILQSYLPTATVVESQ